MLSRVDFSVWSLAFGHDLRRAVPEIRKAGFQGLQLDAVSGGFDLTALSQSGRREIARLITSHALKISSIRIDIGQAGMGVHADVDRVLDRVDAILNAAAELHSPVVAIDLGRLPPVQKTIKAKPKITSDMAGLLIIPDSVATKKMAEEDAEPVATTIDPAILSHWDQAMELLGEMADRYGLMLALSSSLSSFRSLSSLVKRSDCGWFGVDLDPSMMLKDEWSLDDIFDELGGSIRNVRARDAIKGEDRRTKPAPIGRGDVPWIDVLKRLDASDFCGAITVDPNELVDPHSGAFIAIKHLTELAST